ncbi:hypothetical protein [Methylomonas sp. AM2-LC]|uniref:hypothetical protein n=1 Tax=Methylomonas sp. AM2-LC TaxID=3153301 RepID=UPI0032679145
MNKATDQASRYFCERMKFHPLFHSKQKQAWTTTDQKYLIENYHIDGPEHVSLVLERTIHTVMQRAFELRKKGIMSKPEKRSYSKRIRSISESENVMSC